MPFLSKGLQGTVSTDASACSTLSMTSRSNAWRRSPICQFPAVL
jgi:hypothetical protein